MRHCLLHLFFLSTCIYQVAAQNEPKLSFGTPNINELQAVTSTLDTSAEAEILIDKEQIMFVVEKDFMIRTVYHGKIKILKKSGLDRGTIRLRCEVDGLDKEYINNVKGFTHNLENGQVVTTKWTDAAVFYEKMSDQVSMTKIIAPNLKVGSVFEFQYTRNTPFSVSMRPNNWSFQGTVPSRWSEIVAYIPAWFFYQTHYSGFLPFAINEIRDTTLFFDERFMPGVVCRYAIKDAPAIKDEEYTPASRDCIANLEFELSGYQERNGKVHYLSGSWTDVYKRLKSNENFGDRLEKTEFFNSIAKSFENIKDTMERVDAIFKYITKEIKWNGDFGLGAGSLLKAFEKKSASGTEMNMLLVALLRHASVPANMAVLSTRGNGRINVQMPRTDRFNHGIAHVRVEGKDVFMDATEKYAKPNMLPVYSISPDIFILEPDTGRMLSFKTKEKRWDLETIQYEINPLTFELKGNCEIVHGGYDAIDAKNRIDEIGKDEFLKDQIKLNSDWQVDDLLLEYKNRSDASVQLKYVFSGTANHQAADKMYFNPLHELRFLKNPFEAEQRIYPVDFGTPLEHICLIKFVVPEGYELVDLPVSQNFALPEKAGKFAYSVELKDRELNIRSHLSLSKSYFAPEYYAQLREFFNIVVENQAKLIVLKKL